MENFIEKWAYFQGIRAKILTEDKFVLVSTVFTKVVLSESLGKDKFCKTNLKKYINFS
jgi:hypothetical protein